MNVVQTGDTTNIWFYILLMTATLGIIIFLYFNSRNK